MSENKCSLKVVKGGKRLHGTAAVLHMTSREGGFDKWLKDYTEKVAQSAAETAIRELMQEQQMPKLKVVG
jgi:hypothetical protein